MEYALKYLLNKNVVIVDVDIDIPAGYYIDTMTPPTFVTNTFPYVK